MTVLIRYCIKITIKKLSGCRVRHQIILDIDVAFSFCSFFFLFMRYQKRVMISCVKAQ